MYQIYFDTIASASTICGYEDNKKWAADIRQQPIIRNSGMIMPREQ